ncbi:sialate O-acetylesterase [Akkermansiaceae bacterium]|nr:sialate O-acetylesterase [Akkermansiaceae bacterium]MDA7888050.1 sialate O-acetylesterase [Akkermansiaceae bacterium]
MLPLIVVCLLSLAGVAASHAAHYRVYLLGGQSNANGRGDAAKLTGPLASPQKDVRFYWHRTQGSKNVGHLVEDAWIDLAPGSGHGSKKPVYAKEFGPEVAFGRAMADADPSVNIAIIKFSVGGSNLYKAWSAKGPLYATFKKTVQAGLAALTSAGDTYEMGGMLWQQGENDAVAAGADAYEANLIALVKRVRVDFFDGKTTPFVLGSLSDSQYGSKITTRGTPAYKVRKAQEAVAAKLPAVGIVKTDGFPVRPSDSIHLDHDAQISLGKGLAALMRELEAGVNR